MHVPSPIPNILIIKWHALTDDACMSRVFVAFNPNDKRRVQLMVVEIEEISRMIFILIPFFIIIKIVLIYFLPFFIFRF